MISYTFIFHPKGASNKIFFSTELLTVLSFLLFRNTEAEESGAQKFREGTERRTYRLQVLYTRGNGHSKGSMLFYTSYALADGVYFISVMYLPPIRYIILGL